MLRNNLTKGMEFLKSEVIKEITAQGHNASGKLIASVEAVILERGPILVGQILINDYSIYLDKGVKPEKVPYTRGSGAKSSKYIDALIEWSKYIKPSLSFNERKSFAFAVANKAKKEGHPTKGSYRFSKNGRRTSWSEYAFDRNIDKFVKLLDLERSFVAELENKISEFLTAA